MVIGKRYSKYILYGAGIIAHKFYYQFDDRKLIVRVFDKSVGGNFIDDIKIEKPEVICKGSDF